MGVEESATTRLPGKEVRLEGWPTGAEAVQSAEPPPAPEPPPATDAAVPDSTLISAIPLSFWQLNSN